VDGKKVSYVKIDVYQIVTDRIIALLESGTVPWRKPWKGGGPPQNLITKRSYRGINVFLLNATRFAAPFWLSFNQVQTIGATVRKGEHSCPVVFWKKFEVDPDDTKDEEQAKKRPPLLRYYNVFNVEQCEGVEASLLPAVAAKEFNPIDRCDEVVAKMPHRPKIVHGGGRAMYCPVQDRVTMPNTVSFDSPEFYYSTLFHELIHATGHGSRLGRNEIVNPSKFGSEPYSREELVAEMGAAFLCGHCGIETQTIENSASYVQGWLGRLRNDRRMIVYAAAHAQKACDCIRDVHHEAEGTSDAIAA
jgi:antirestriction protein ArdC